MNYGIVTRVLGSLLIVEAVLMLPSYLIAVSSQGPDRMPFLITILLTAIIGGLMTRRKTGQSSIGAKEGLAIVALGWLFASIMGALPLHLTGVTNNYIDAFFEIVSGFTTTGATILKEIEGLPQGILFWRSFTHWIGGMGILVFTLALMPALGIGGFQIFKAESPGPMAGKIAPRLRDTAKILYITYVTITLAEVLLLSIGGMGVYESFIHTFGTVGTGGFSNRNGSIADFDSTYIHMVIAFFMVASGVNFSLYYSFFRGKSTDLFKDEEFRLYIKIIVIATLAIAIDLWVVSYHNVGFSLRDSFFQVASIITTTGYSTADFDLWPTFSKGILLILMFVGASAGSTGGGMKIIRILVMMKLVKREVGKLYHPRAVIPIKINNKVIPSETVARINSFLALYLLLFLFSTLLVSLEQVDLLTAGSAVAATLGNIGPGLELVGPVQNYAFFSWPTKLLLSFLMLLGRLELFTIIALIAPKNWRIDV
ncbi:TrkH family potassium uptake protein [Gudongella sp. DL1XJH-153]|uniref:TrkH family potassium uptake protein n=1 Tax=Gudongella sp. DL1XJH-153 TaxID=3409804 RepID=UPI003BB4B148